MPRLSHVIAFDDAPFAREHRGDVDLFGVVFAGARMDGAVRGKVRRDGANAARVMGHVIGTCQFAEHLQLVMLQGIAVAGFNVVDVFKLHEVTRLPILVVARKEPDYAAIRAVAARILVTRLIVIDIIWTVRLTSCCRSSCTRFP